MIRIISAYFFGVWLIGAASAHATEWKQKTVGWVEPVRVKDVAVTLDAKLDTGAQTSSLSAQVLGFKVNPNPKKGFTDQTVIFSLLDKESSREHVFERDVVRFANIRLKQEKDKFSTRPVVYMTFCIAGREVMKEVNLTDRSHFNYPVLVARNMLSAANLVIHPAKTNITQPGCAQTR